MCVRQSRRRRLRTPFCAAAHNRPMGTAGRVLITTGVVLLAFGVVLVIVGRLDLPLGRLPGDFSHKGKNFSFYFPLGSSLLLSILLTLILYLIGRFRR